MTPKAAVWAVWGVVCLCASDWRARAVIWEVFRGRKAPVANRDAKSSKFGRVVYNSRQRLHLDKEVDSELRASCEGVTLI